MMDDVVIIIGMIDDEVFIIGMIDDEVFIIGMIDDEVFIIGMSMAVKVSICPFNSKRSEQMSL